MLFSIVTRQLDFPDPTRQLGSVNGETFKHYTSNTDVRGTERCNPDQTHKRDDREV